MTVLGIWVETTEGASFWLRVMNELKARGVEDVLIVVCDGLTGLPAAVTACWPQTLPQTCIVQLTRASLRWVNDKDRKRVWTDNDVGKAYPAIKRQWEASWEQVIAFFAFSPEVRKVRKVTCTTNMVESINSQLRKISKTRWHFPTDEALVKLLYLGCRELARTDIRDRAGRSNDNWKMALNQVDVMFPGRLDQA